jgi:hypothetical protein
MRALSLFFCIVLGFLACSKGGGTPQAPVPDGGTVVPPLPPEAVYPTGRPQGYTNPIPAENAQEGDPGWRITRGDGAPGSSLAARQRLVHLEAYADRVSLHAGDSAQVMVHAPDGPQRVHWRLYRLGWYGGAGARKLAEGTAVAPVQPACPEDADGYVSCRWSPTFTVTVPKDAVSGLFLIRIDRDSDLYGTYTPLVVKDERMSDLYFQASVTTYQAYNRWFGQSFYNSVEKLPTLFAAKVSWDRPYIHDYGSGQVLRYELPMAAYLERYGYDVGYTTNLDVTREGSSSLRRHGAFLSVGHDEYWDGVERDAVETARDAGVHLFFFGANSAYWKVRLGDAGSDGNARTMTCYKVRPDKFDPMYKSPSQTGLFRGTEIGHGEEELVGTTYEEQVLFGHSWVVADGSLFAYDGTGLKTGEALPGLVGYEYDVQLSFDTPGKTSLVARSPVVNINGAPSSSTSVTYRAPGGALVFSAGSIYFAWSVDPFCATAGACGSDPGAPGPFRDARAERLVANLFNASLKLPVPGALLSPSAPRPPPVVPPASGTVSTLASGLSGPSSVARLSNGDLVFTDPRGHRIWRASGGAVSPFAGDGTPGGEAVSGQRYDNVPALSARFRGPTSIWADAVDNVYVADTMNSAIRKIANDGPHTVTTLAGTLFIAGELVLPMGISGLYHRDASGNPVASALIVADQGTGLVRRVDLVTGAVATLAGGGSVDGDGPGASIALFNPTAVASDDDGRVFVVVSAGFDGIKVKSIGAGPGHPVVTLTTGGTGFADGAGPRAAFSAQGGLLWDGTSLLVADPGNQRIRRVVPGANAAATAVSTFAGSGAAGASDGPAASASFGLPLGMWRDRRSGTVYVADGTGSIRAIQP